LLVGAVAVVGFSAGFLVAQHSAHPVARVTDTAATTSDEIRRRIPYVSFPKGV
jgi:hypothetical protein